MQFKVVKLIIIVFIVVPCILVSVKFIHQQMHSLLNLTEF